MGIRLLETLGSRVKGGIVADLHYIIAAGRNGKFHRSAVQQEALGSGDFYQSTSGSNGVALGGCGLAFCVGHQGFHHFAVHNDVVFGTFQGVHGVAGQLRCGVFFTAEGFQNGQPLAILVLGSVTAILDGIYGTASCNSDRHRRGILGPHGFITPGLIFHGGFLNGVLSGSQSAGGAVAVCSGGDLGYELAAAVDVEQPAA